VKSLELHTVYLDLVYDLYTQGEFAAEDRAQYIRPNFVLGLTARESSLRKKFFEYSFEILIDGYREIQILYNIFLGN